jgi:hypothetical protein
MSKTFHQFGRVLFDELEQIAFRRGGFASLLWVKFSVKEIRGRQQKLIDEEARCQRACRVAWGQKGREQLEKDDQVAWDAAIKALRRETGDKYNNQGNYERVIRGAVVRRSRDIAGQLLWAARRFVPVIPAF